MCATRSKEFSDFLANYLDKSDVYIAKAMADASSMIINKRLELKMNQSEFASFMGVSQSMVSKWESGDYNFTIESLAEICAKLNMYFSLNIVREESFGKSTITDWSCAIDNGNYSENVFVGDYAVCAS